MSIQVLVLCTASYFKISNPVGGLIVLGDESVPWEMAHERREIHQHMQRLYVMFAELFSVL